MNTILLHSDRFGSYRYGAGHPMRPFRLQLTFDLISALGIIRLPSSEVIEARQATDEEILTFHTPEYLKILKEANSGITPQDGPIHGLGAGDNPVFPGVYAFSALYAGGSIQAAEVVASGEASTAFNISGGLHHATADGASGFCYINDCVLAIKRLVAAGKRVIYIDIDAHHGDGVEYAFNDTDQVLTLSIHEDGRWLFPGTGSVTDIGNNAGRGYSINLPLGPGINDGDYIKAFDEVVPLFVDAFNPDIIVTQLGVDTFATDPITHMNLTTVSFEHAVRAFQSLNIPWVALGGGGYDLSNVARGWTIAWAIMNGIDPPESIPEEFLLKYGSIFQSASLRDMPSHALKEISWDGAPTLEKDIRYLKEEVLPLVKDGSR
ncbi:MAG: acetoin utilization protein AcuC [Deltaproteobacteria bacterium]